MKTAFAKLSFVPTVLALACVISSKAQAGWGSVRASNHVEHRPEPAHHEAQPVHRELERVQDRRRLDIEAERHHAFFWWGFHPGMPIGVLPAGYVQISVGPVGYYYYDGVYYQPTTAGSYAVVAPPVGAIVPQLPDGAEAVQAGSVTYYYGGGAFYLPQPTGFEVVPAPMGVVVSGLPPDAGPVNINGVVYYLSGTTYLRPAMQGGVTVYVTARP